MVPGFKSYPALLLINTFLTGGEWPALPPPTAAPTAERQAAPLGF